MARRRWIAAAVGAGVLVAASWDSPVPAVRNPLRAEMTRRLEDVYDVAETTTRISVDAVTMGALRTSAESFLGVLPLDAEVRARVLARVRSEALVDEVVPFLLFLGDLYDVQHAGAAAGSGAGAPPAAAPPTDPAAPPSTLVSPKALAGLVTLYDAVWLRDRPADADLSATLRCAPDDADLRARAAAAAPVVRDLLGDLDLDGDAALAVARVRKDDALLRTISTSFVEFVDAETCKHYRVFATREARRRQLGDWLVAGIDAGDEAVWEWLDWADTRPRAVHVIVDGLQGHLLRALATDDTAFFRAALAATEVPRPSVPSSPGPALDLDALRAYAAGHASDGFPTFRALLADGGVVEQGLSTTPTISVRNLPLVMTGAPVAGPGGTGIPNFHFVDRTPPDGRPWYFYGNDALQLSALTAASGMRTMFTRLGRLDTMSCGSQYDERAGYSFDGFLNLAVGEHLRDFGDRLCVAELERRAAVERTLRADRARLRACRDVLARPHHPWELYDRWVAAGARTDAKRLARTIADQSTDGLPDYLQYYNPWPDHFAHAVGPTSDPIVGAGGEYARLDGWLGRIVAAYADVEDQTLFVMAGDHGLTPVLWIVRPEEVVFDALARRGVKLVVRKISSDEGEGPKLTDRFAPPSMRGIDVVVASTAGGNYMLDVFLDQGAGWARQPVLEELRTWRTLAGARVDLVDELARRLDDSLQYLVVRTAPCSPAGGAIAVIRARGGVRETQRITRDGDHVTVDGDPIVSDPTAIDQLAHLYDTDRAGTINLFPVEGVGYNTVVPGRHAGESFAEKDAFVGVWGAPVRAARAGRAPLPFAVNGQVAPTAYAWLTGEAPRAGTDGWGFDPIGWDPR